MKLLQGELHIGTPSRGGVVEITLTDSASRATAVVITVPLAEFALALASNRLVGAQYEFNNSGRVGLRRETKTEFLQCGIRDALKNKDLDSEEMNAAVAPLEVDGWKVRREDVLNHRNWGTWGTVKVVCVRYVEPVTPAAAISAAGDLNKLMGEDVLAILESIPDEDRQSLADYIIAARPELKEWVVVAMDALHE